MLYYNNNGYSLLTKLISKSHQYILHVNLFTLKGKRIAIDTSIFIYKSLINVRYNGDYLRNKKVKLYHIYGLFNKIVILKSYSIEPIFIFDGKPPNEKVQIREIKELMIVKNKTAIK